MVKTLYSILHRSLDLTLFFQCLILFCFFIILLSCHPFSPLFRHLPHPHARIFNFSELSQVQPDRAKMPKTRFFRGGVSYFSNQSHLSSVIGFTVFPYRYRTVRSGCKSSWHCLHTLTSCRSSPSQIDNARSGLSFRCLT